MRSLTYAGETVTTTDEVAAALIELTAAIAREGRAEAVSIPIVLAQTQTVGQAELVIGVGNDVLSAPTDWEGEEPDFADAAATLQSHTSYPRKTESSDEGPFEATTDTYWDPDLEGFARG